MTKNTFGKPKISNDECYTTKLTAEYIVNKYYYLLEGKKIILPCDCEWSELYKACSAKNLDCEIAQDMWGVDYSKYDLVFTNPLFHELNKWIRYLNNNNIKYLLFAPWSIIAKCVLQSHDFYHTVHYIEDSDHYSTMFYIEDFDRRPNNLNVFKRPDGSDYAVHWGLITNLKEGRALVEAKPDIRVKATDDYQSYKGMWVDLVKCNYLNYDYKYDKGKLVIRNHQSEIKKIQLW